MTTSTSSMFCECQLHLPSRVEQIKANAVVVISGQHADRDQTRTYRMRLVDKLIFPRGWQNMVCPTFRPSPIHLLASSKRCLRVSRHSGCPLRHQRPRHCIDHRRANLRKFRNTSPARMNAVATKTTMYTYERPNDYPIHTIILASDRAYPAPAHASIDTAPRSHQLGISRDT